MSEIILPPGFEALAVHAEWALDTPDERHRARLASTPARLEAFYNGILPWLEKILEELDRFPLGALPESHHALFNLAFAVIEVAPHVELYRSSPGVPFAFEELRFVAAHGGQPTWAGRPPAEMRR
ncbi:MAG TPA: hypothetical protein VFF98_01045 [Novosphingobium sp.]|nr:hypothetical protein [Novosphingobium sp.]HZV10382.1 hypothetical protein [Novosphingobium sp.]